eukprot:784054-Amphidinium_carterae.1
MIAFKVAKCHCKQIPHNRNSNPTSFCWKLGGNSGCDGIAVIVMVPATRKNTHGPLYKEKLRTDLRSYKQGMKNHGAKLQRGLVVEFHLQSCCFGSVSVNSSGQFKGLRESSRGLA